MISSYVFPGLLNTERNNSVNEMITKNGQETINDLVSEIYEISIDDMFQKLRTNEIKEPRQVCQYFGYKFKDKTKLSLPKIGWLTGHKNHATVIFSYKKISQLITCPNETRLRKKIELIEKKIESLL